MSEKRKLKVAVLMGGRSGEHEVSLQSGMAVMEALDRDRYEIIPVGISNNGEWHLLDPEDPLENPTDPIRIRLRTTGKIVAPVPIPGQPWIVIENSSYTRFDAPDAVFPVLHGTFGEDGTIQGLLELMEVPFVAAGVAGSAVGLDKDLLKRLFREAGLIIADFLCLRYYEWIEGRDQLLDNIHERFKMPVFVKPANLGSSVGICRVDDESEMIPAIDDAFRYDEKIIVEEGINGREIEVSVLGNEAPKASVPGEIVPRHSFYSYEAKYLDAEGAELIIPADLPPQIVERIQHCAIEAFRAASCEGMARVDFFLERGTDRIVVNELNTIPGFTRISMYPKLWEASGLPFPELVDRLISLAIERHERKRRLSREYFPV